LHEDLIDIQRQGEIIDHVTQYGRSYFIVVTRKPELRETRPGLREVTHAARVGAIEQRAAWDDPLLESFYTDGILRGDA